MTITLNTVFDNDLNVWFAFEGANRDESRAIGEGSTAEAARADFWWRAHDFKTASIEQTSDGRWELCDGLYFSVFDTREEAVQYAEENQYLLNPTITPLV